MVQRKLPNKPGINPHLLKPDTHVLNPQTHDLKKIMKKTRPAKPDPPPLKRKPPPPSNGAGSTTGIRQKPPPNYMKSTTSFEARKERKIPAQKSSEKPRPASLKLVKSPSFKPVRLSKKTCSSTLKDSKFPNYLELDPGGTELTGSSAIKVCPYSYCSLNGHHHAPAPPLKSFLSARRRAMKAQKSFKIGCLSPRRMYMKENKESEDFVIGVTRKDDRVSGCFPPRKTDLKENEETACLIEEESEIFGTGISRKDNEGYYGGLEMLYDEKSVSSGAWPEEGDYESDGSYQQTEIDRNEFEGKTDEMDEDKIEGLTGKPDGFPIGDHEIECGIDHRREETSQESEASRDESGKRQTIIYNIISFNISIIINREKTERSEAEKGVGKVPEMGVAASEKATEPLEEPIISDEDDDLNQTFAGKQEDPEKEPITSDKDDAYENKISVSDEVEDRNQTVAGKQEDPDKERTSGEELPESPINLIGSPPGKKPGQEMENSSDFNPRGPNFLPLEAEPDAETVDLRHQMMDDRKTAEEWMVDFALQQAVTTLAPARNRKVALLVEAFEKVMPIPKYGTRNGRDLNAFTKARPMQACS